MENVHWKVTSAEDKDGAPPITSILCSSIAATGIKVKATEQKARSAANDQAMWERYKRH